MLLTANASERADQVNNIDLSTQTNGSGTGVTIAVVCVAVLLCVCCCILFIFIRRRQKRQKEKQGNDKGRAYEHNTHRVVPAAIPTVKPDEGKTPGKDPEIDPVKDQETLVFATISSDDEVEQSTAQTVVINAGVAKKEKETRQPSSTQQVHSKDESISTDVSQAEVSTENAITHPPEGGAVRSKKDRTTVKRVKRKKGGSRSNKVTFTDDVAKIQVGPKRDRSRKPRKIKSKTNSTDDSVTIHI